MLETLASSQHVPILVNTMVSVARLHHGADVLAEVPIVVLLPLPFLPVDSSIVLRYTESQS